MRGACSRQLTGQEENGYTDTSIAEARKNSPVTFVTLSIIIPAFNESRKITRDVETAAGFLAAHEIAGEVIVVDDGSADGTTDAAHTAQVPANVKKTVITAHQHKGKGFAIRTGVLASTCEYVMFADCGCTVPYKNVLEGLRLIREGQCEIAHG